MYCNNNFSGKCWAIIAPKLSESPRNPKYRSLDYRGTTEFSRQRVMNINGQFRHGNSKYLIFHSYDKIDLVITKTKMITTWYQQRFQWLLLNTELAMMWRKAFSNSVLQTRKLPVPKDIHHPPNTSYDWPCSPSERWDENSLPLPAWNFKVRLQNFVKLQNKR